MIGCFHFMCFNHGTFTTSSFQLESLSFGVEHLVWYRFGRVWCEIFHFGSAKCAEDFCFPPLSFHEMAEASHYHSDGRWGRLQHLILVAEAPCWCTPKVSDEWYVCVELFSDCGFSIVIFVSRPHLQWWFSSLIPSRGLNDSHQRGQMGPVEAVMSITTKSYPWGSKDH